MIRTVRPNLKNAGSAIATAGVLALAAMAAPAHAQDQAAEADDSVILVTAQKREQNILEVPVAVSAIGEDVLDAAQVNDFEDLTLVSPSLTITSGGSQAGHSIALRGVGTVSFSTAVESSVLVVVDDVALLQAGQAFSSISDPQRVEVLRGPQGTLFGKNASAGVVNIVTQDPTDYFTGYGQFSLTDDQQYRAEGAISGPLNDNGGFRVSGYFSDYDGYIDNLTTGSTLGGENTWGMRGKVRQELGDVTFTLIADYGEATDSMLPDTYLRVDTTDADGNPLNEDYALAGITPGFGNNVVRNDTDRFGESNQLVTALKADIDLGFATLSSITSFQDWTYNSTNDQDGEPVPTIRQDTTYNAKQFSQELRLTSPTDGVFDYIVGLYFADGSTDRTFVRTTTIPPIRQNWDSTADTTSYAAFAQLGYDITPDTLVTLGGRVNHEKIGVYFADNRGATPIEYTGDDSETAVTGKLALQHFFGGGLMAFASVATGYKGQAYDISSGFDQRRADNPIASESSMNYEIGLSGSALGGDAQFQLVGFWTDYDDFQAQGVNAQLLVPQFELTNVGSLRTRGVEFEGAYSPSDNLTLFASAAYVDARIREFPDAQCYFGQTEEQGCVVDPETNQPVQDIAGEKLGNSPDFKFNVGFNFDQPITPSLALFLQGNYTWQSDVNFSLSQNPRTVQDSYGIANAAIGIQDPDENWRLSLFVNNLFDKAYASRIIDDTNPRNDPFVLTQQLPRNYTRYIGVRARFGF
ncbi:TonB-dependent receptor [Aurantiacibacter suaedae]|uniref:TonB-dependent receptor n=1 Tax=Aurantiacibacter suaedae TaxID=2545755 RepID=UPI0010F9ECA1|nr:TonB-dependent receptor [Aurantiacibacter suaedae]